MPSQDHNGRPQLDGAPSSQRDGDAPRPISDGRLAMILALVAVALVLGYLFVNKMADISHQEDCVLANRRTC